MASQTLVRKPPPAEPALGLGIYSLREAASIIGVKKERVTYLLSTYWDKQFSQDAGGRYTWTVKKKKYISFLLLMELLVVKKLEDMGISKKAILKARAVLAQKVDSAHPFANRGLTVYGADVFFSTDTATIRTDGTGKQAFAHIIHELGEKINYGEDDGDAETYWPLGKDSSIVINPAIQFGQPVVAGTRITVDNILGYLESGETIEGLINSFDLTGKQIMDSKVYAENYAIF